METRLVPQNLANFLEFKINTIKLTGLGLWMGTAGVVAMALAWLRMTAPPDGFIQEPDQAYDYIIGT